MAQRHVVCPDVSPICSKSLRKSLRKISNQYDALVHTPTHRCTLHYNSYSTIFLNSMSLPMPSILDITGHNLVWRYKDLALESGESSELFLYFQVSFIDNCVKSYRHEFLWPRDRHETLKFIISTVIRAWKTKKSNY